MKQSDRKRKPGGGRKPTVSPGDDIVPVSVNLPATAAAKLTRIGPTRSGAARDILLAELAKIPG